MQFIAVSVAIWKNQSNSKIAFYIATNNVDRPIQKTFQCGHFIADGSHLNPRCKPFSSFKERSRGMEDS